MKNKDNKDEAVVKALAKNISPFKSRFHDALWFENMNKLNVLILGSGGIGSWVTFILNRIGCKIYLYDMDVVEEHNLGGQMFKKHDVGKYKCDAIVNVCNDFNDQNKIVTHNTRYDNSGLLLSTVISAFDNMASRKLAFEEWVNFVTQNPEFQSSAIFIDGRLLAEDYQVFAVTFNEKQIEEYRKNLFDDSEVAEVMCTLKSTTHCSMAIASEIVSLLTNHIANVTLGEELRNVPFKIVKSIQSYQYTIE